MRADIKKRTLEAQRWQKKVKKLRNGVSGPAPGSSTSSLAERQLNAANQELLRAADAAQLDLNSRLAVLQVSRAGKQRPDKRATANPGARQWMRA